jgi:RNA polymerase sigma factor (sigma-70 family)
MNDSIKTSIRRLAAVATLNLLASAPAPASRLPQEELRTRLVCDMQAGDRGAFDQLFRRESAWSFKVASRAIPNEEDAQDVAMEAWQKIWEGKERLEQPQSFRGWASSIITHVAYQQLRTKKRHQSVEDALPLPASDDESPLNLGQMSRDPVGDQVIERLSQQEKAEAQTAAYARLERGLLELGQGLSRARSEVYQMLLKHLAQHGGGNEGALRVRIADEFRISRNAASMRLLWLYRKATEHGVPLQTIIADPELASVAQPIFHRVAERMRSAAM